MVHCQGLSFHQVCWTLSNSLIFLLLFLFTLANSYNGCNLVMLVVQLSIIGWGMWYLADCLDSLLESIPVSANWLWEASAVYVQCSGHDQMTHFLDETCISVISFKAFVVSLCKTGFVTLIAAVLYRNQSDLLINML